MLGELANAREHCIRAGNNTESDAYYQMAVQDAQKSEDSELISIVSTYKY